VGPFHLFPLKVDASQSRFAWAEASSLPSAHVDLCLRLVCCCDCRPQHGAADAQDVCGVQAGA
jgi:hypothetical protein